MDKNSVVVYWSPGLFSKEDESWNLLYPEPEPVKYKLQKIRSDIRRGIQVCPATKDHMKNLYACKSAIKDDFDLPVDFLKSIHNTPDFNSIPSTKKQIVSLKKERESSFQGYSNLTYNLSWIFFCEEPLVAKFTAPYFPPVSPSPGAMLACGEFDIGQWFRPFNLDYHIPLDNNSFLVEENQELCYVKFETTKKVILKRFTFNKVLFNYASEASNAPNRYEELIPLAKRYQMAKNSKMNKLILKEIKNNLVE